MKKIIMLLLLFSLSISVAACNNSMYTGEDSSKK